VEGGRRNIGQTAQNSSLTKDGTSILTLRGDQANTYTGTTSVTQGTLELGKAAGIVAVPGNLVIGNDGVSAGQTVALLNNGQIKDTAQVSIFQNATLDLQNHTQTIGSLADGAKDKGGQVVIGTGSLTTGSAASTTYSGTFTGTGTLDKTATPYSQSAARATNLRGRSSSSKESSRSIRDSLEPTGIGSSRSRSRREQFLVGPRERGIITSISGPKRSLSIPVARWRRG
jgi:fibronectin-binding autotransporter adhesin